MLRYMPYSIMVIQMSEFLVISRLTLKPTTHAYYPLNGSITKFAMNCINLTGR